MSISVINRGSSTTGLFPELIVTSKAGSTVDILQNGVIVDSYTYGSQETVHVFMIRKGTYSVRGLYYGHYSDVVSIVVDISASFPVTLSYRTYLYNRGDECVDITGGWGAYAYASYGGLLPSSGNRAGAPSLTKYSTYMYASQPSYAVMGGIFPANAVDLTPYTKFCWEGTEIGDYSNYLHVTASKANSYREVGYRLITGAMTYAEIDISALNGNYYPMISVSHAYADKSGSSVTTEKLWLE